MIKNAPSIDKLVFTAVFSPLECEKVKARAQIRSFAQSRKIFLSSIRAVYKMFGQGKLSLFTVPAINIRTLTYDTAQIIFELMNQYKIGPVLFEIARSEIVYTDQKPDEYVTVILAAAIKSGYQGPVFIQGDHYQLKRSSFLTDPQKEIKAVCQLIKESIAAGFYNIDIDASTLVDLDKPTLPGQQRSNAEITAEITKYIRSIQPENMMISIGGEIGHIGGKNSTVEEFQAFMNQYRSIIGKQNLEGISKVSVQTGTSHGGIPLPDGSIAKVSLDFNVLQSIGFVARKEYHIGGAVQHGASTLPIELFDRFPEIGTLEIHLATGFQNIVFDTIPSTLREEIYTWIEKECKADCKEGITKKQFIYKTRKKALGPFKKQLWELSPQAKKPIREALYKQLLLLFQKLNIINTAHILTPYVSKSHNTY